MIRRILFVVCFLFFSFESFAKTLEIEMLNKLGKEKMVYSVKVAKIDVNDKIIWKSVSKGHNVEFIKKGVPDGVGKFKSKFNKDVEYKFEVPGIYAYWCTPHKNMGMIGFVVVGDDKSNLDAIKKLRFSSKSKKLAPGLIDQL